MSNYALNETSTISYSFIVLFRAMMLCCKLIKWHKSKMTKFAISREQTQLRVNTILIINIHAETYDDDMTKPCLHTNTHTHPHTHTYTYIYTHKHTHTYTHTNTRKGLHTHTSTQAHMHLRHFKWIPTNIYFWTWYLSFPPSFHLIYPSTGH